MIKKITLILCSLLLLGSTMLIPSFESSAADGARLGVEDYYIEGDVLVPGTEATVHLTVKNFSQIYDASNAFLTFYSESGKIYPAYGTDNLYFIGQLGRGQSKELEVKVKVSSDLDVSQVEVRCSFTVGNMDLLAMNDSVVVLPVAAGSPAFIDIDSFSIDSGVLIPGKDAKLCLNLHNLSKTASAENVVLTITDLSGQVFPVYGTDNQYPIGQLDKDETKAVEIPLSVSNGFYSSDLDLECSFIYTSESGQASNTLHIVLPSTDSSPVVVKNLDISRDAILNSKTLLNITLWNNSSENISDARLLIDGAVSDESKEIPLSTLNSQQNYADDCHVVFTESGSQQITIRLQYTDLNGQTRESELGNYVVNVGSKAGEYRRNFSNNILKYAGWLIIAFGAISSVYVLVQYIKKRM